LLNLREREREKEREEKGAIKRILVTFPEPFPLHHQISVATHTNHQTSFSNPTEKKENQTLTYIKFDQSP